MGAEVSYQVHEGVDHVTERNYVHWDITTVCNYKCSYCYAMREYREQWNKEASKETIDSILRAINLSTLPVFLGLLGGEPTLSKHFIYILEYLRDNFFTRNGDREDNGDRVYITSNLSQNTKWFKEFYEASEFSNKLFFLGSWHSREANPDAFMNNINILLKKGYKVKINVMIDPDMLQWDKTKEVLLSLQKTQRTKEYLENYPKGYGELIIHPHFVYINEHQLYNYPIGVNEFFGSLIKDSSIPKEFIRNGEFYNDLEIFTQSIDGKPMNDFQGWRCHLNNFEVNLYGDVNKFCVQEKDNLIENPLFFRVIKETKVIECPHKACTCDGLLKVRKDLDV